MTSKVSTPAAPNPGQTYSDTAQAMINLAPQLYAASAQFDPQYAMLNADTSRIATLGYQGMNAQGAQQALADMDPSTRAQVEAEAAKYGVSPAQWVVGHTMEQAKAGDPVAQASLQKYGTWNPGIVDTQIEASKRIQGAQSELQAQQLQGNLKNLQGLAGGAVEALRGANPNVAKLNDQATALASGFNPASFQMQAGPGIAADQVSAANFGFNARARDVRTQQDPTLQMANQTVQGMLASGGRISDQEANDIANRTLSYFNTAGRAQDPAAAAKLALNLDSAQQARMNNAVNLTGQVIGLNQGAQGQNLSAQQANQQADLSRSGLNLNALQSNAQLSQQASLANQQANLQASQFNAGNLWNMNQYNADANARALAAQQGLLGQAYQQEMGVTNPAIGMVLNPSNSMGYAQQAYGQGAATPTTSTSFNPYGVGTQLYSDYYNAKIGADVANTNATNAMWGAGIGGIATIGGMLGGGYLAGQCWVAREAFGFANPMWLKFRDWLLGAAPEDLRNLYTANGEWLAYEMARDPELKKTVRAELETIMEEVYGR